jgi:hypothetical protein
MEKFKKEYVGKGKKVDGLNFDLLRITLKMDILKQLSREYEGSELVTIEISELKQPDEFGRTHAAWVNVKEAVAAE